jgi:hypothetical protein
MLGQSTRQTSHFTLSPLLVIGAIFAGLLVIEGLLVARFWVQIAATNASEGLHGLVLDLSAPLVAPFTDAQSRAEESVSSFDRNTLVAAIVYLAGAVLLTVVTMALGGLSSGTDFLSTRKRRSLLKQFDHHMIEYSGARLVATASVSLSAGQASRALRMIRLDRFGADVYVIPVEGGSIVAAFAGIGSAAIPLPFLGRAAAMRERFVLRRALRAVEQRFNASRAPALTVRAR